jgi:hypothetical protein
MPDLKLLPSMTRVVRSSGAPIRTTWATLTAQDVSDAMTVCTPKREDRRLGEDCGRCHELVAMDEAAPEIRKTLRLEERISKVQKE